MEMSRSSSMRDSTISRSVPSLGHTEFQLRNSTAKKESASSATKMPLRNEGMKMTIADFHLAKIVQEPARIYSKTTNKDTAPEKLFLKPIHSELIHGIFSRPLVLSILQNELPEIYEEGVDSTTSLVMGRSDDAARMYRNILYVKAFDLVDSQEAGTTIDMSAYERFSRTLLSKLGSDVSLHFAPSRIEWWVENLKRVVAVRHVGQGKLRIKVSKAAIERYLIDVIDKLRSLSAAQHRQTAVSSGGSTTLPVAGSLAIAEGNVLSPRSKAAGARLAPIPASPTAQTAAGHILDAQESLGSLTDSIGYSSVGAKMSELSITDAGANFDFSGYTKGLSTKHLFVNEGHSEPRRSVGRAATTTGVRGSNTHSQHADTIAAAGGRGGGGARGGRHTAPRPKGIIDLGGISSSPNGATSFLDQSHVATMLNKSSGSPFTPTPFRMADLPLLSGSYNEESSIVSTISSLEGLREASYVKTKQKRIKQMYDLLLKSANLSDDEESQNPLDEESLGMGSFVSSSMGSLGKSKSRSPPSRARRPRTQAQGRSISPSLRSNKSAVSASRSPSKSQKLLSPTKRGNKSKAEEEDENDPNDIRRLKIRDESELVALSAILRARKHGLTEGRGRPLSRVEKALLSSPFAKPYDPSMDPSYDNDFEDDEPNEEEINAVLESFHSTIYAMSAEAVRERAGLVPHRKSSVLSYTSINSARSTSSSVNSHRQSRATSPGTEINPRRSSSSSVHLPKAISVSDEGNNSLSARPIIASLGSGTGTDATGPAPRRHLSTIQSAVEEDDDDTTRDNDADMESLHNFGTEVMNARAAAVRIMDGDPDEEEVGTMQKEPKEIQDTEMGDPHDDDGDQGQWQSFGLHSDVLQPARRDSFEPHPTLNPNPSDMPNPDADSELYEEEMDKFDADTDAADMQQPQYWQQESYHGEEMHHHQQQEQETWQDEDIPNEAGDEYEEEQLPAEHHRTQQHQHETHFDDETFDDDEGADPSEYEYLFTAEEDGVGNGRSPVQPATSSQAVTHSAANEDVVTTAGEGSAATAATAATAVVPAALAIEVDPDETGLVIQGSPIPLFGGNSNGRDQRYQYVGRDAGEDEEMEEEEEDKLEPERAQTRTFAATVDGPLGREVFEDQEMCPDGPWGREDGGAEAHEPPPEDSLAMPAAAPAVANIGRDAAEDEELSPDESCGSGRIESTQNRATEPSSLSSSPKAPKTSTAGSETGGSDLGHIEPNTDAAAGTKKALRIEPKIPIDHAGRDVGEETELDPDLASEQQQEKRTEKSPKASNVPPSILLSSSTSRKRVSVSVRFAESNLGRDDGEKEELNPV